MMHPVINNKKLDSYAAFINFGNRVFLTHTFFGVAMAKVRKNTEITEADLALAKELAASTRTIVGFPTKTPKAPVMVSWGRKSKPPQAAVTA